MIFSAGLTGGNPPGTDDLIDTEVVIKGFVDAAPSRAFAFLRLLYRGSWTTQSASDCQHIVGRCKQPLAPFSARPRNIAMASAC